DPNPDGRLSYEVKWMECRFLAIFLIFFYDPVLLWSLWAERYIEYPGGQKGKSAMSGVNLRARGHWGQSAGFAPPSPNGHVAKMLFERRSGAQSGKFVSILPLIHSYCLALEYKGC
ncbi:MAG: hypothetical protein P4L43_05305, partial [Syntrophobacteraceae bacterium]|nr:hypothetical protein [Syntrophobacteraceae bacterium]